ncbi:hypothetical protein C8Q75DRAFT_810579 [Abortiporus biennis]|nr:hypothetical protein C8Q75DRAFT_810579 [Abortiporus biennis]
MVATSATPAPAASASSDLVPNAAVDDLADIESKEVRHYYRQCQKCWKRRADDVKLFVCGACKITSYCSVTCQRADWPFHKQACKANKAYREQMAEHDESMLALRLFSGEDLDKPLSSQVSVEVGDFLKRFRPLICQAGYRCLQIKSGSPDAWKTHVFVLNVERVSMAKALTVKPWARYRIVGGKSVEKKKLLEEHGAQLKGTFDQGEVYHQENVRVGCIGTITTFIECESAGPVMRCVSWGGYGEDAWDDVKPGEDWMDTLRTAVDRLCGRIQ